MRPRVPVLFASLLAAASCTPFGVVATADVDAGKADSAEGGTQPDSAADAATTACVAPGCEGFDLATWRATGNWYAEGPAEPIAGESVSPPNALRVSVAGTGALAFITRPVLPPSRSVTVRARIKVVEQGTGSIDLLGLRCSARVGLPSVDSYVLLTRVARGYAVQVPTSTGESFDVLTITTFKEWTPVTLVANFADAAYSFQIGAESGGGTLPSACAPQSLEIFVGAGYAKSITAAWDVRFDNVEVVQP